LADSAVSNRSIQDNTINEAKFDAVTRGKLVTNGDGHDHAGGDGAAISHSSVVKDDGRNPHGTTAGDVGAVSTSGGSTVAGSLTVQPSTGPKVTLGTGLFGAGIALLIENPSGQPHNGLVIAGPSLENRITGETTFENLVRFNGDVEIAENRTITFKGNVQFN